MTDFNMRFLQELLLEIQRFVCKDESKENRFSTFTGEVSEVTKPLYFQLAGISKLMLFLMSI